MLRDFLSASDAERALGTLHKFARHDVSRWALTGGLAVEAHHWLRRRPASIRPLNDLDFVTEEFGCIPESLAAEFLFLHVHPLDPPGKTIMQLIDADAAIRVDVFRVAGGIMSRTVRADLPSGPIRLISLEDLVARTARLVLDLADGVTVASKYASDYLRLVELVDVAEMEAAWRDHRKPQHPLSFHESATVLRNLISSRSDLLVTPEYSSETDAACPRCMATAAFQLVDAKVAISLLGYC